MKLENVVTVRIGRNLSRGKEKFDDTLVTYTNEDLNNDLKGEFVKSDTSINTGAAIDDSYLTKIDDIIFSFVSSTAGIVSKSNQGKIINQNFARLIIDNDCLDSGYLCYALNESPYIKRQMAISMQGSTVPKLTPAILKKLEVNLPTIEKQRVIGKAYFTLKKRQSLLRKQAELEEQLYLGALNQLDKK